MPTPVVIDTDPGIDDSIALLLAVASPELDLRAVTTVGGNVGVERTTRNALDVLALAGRPDVPVGAGASRPLVGPGPLSGAAVHGAGGLGGVELPRFPRDADPRGAIALLRDVLAGSPEPVTVVALGPLTNLAVLHAAHPEAFARIERIVLMGGAVRSPLGNVTPTAEFNIWFDPEAAARVYGAGVPITQVGLDVTMTARLHPDAWAPLRGGGRLGRVVLEMVDHYAAVYEGFTGSPATAQHDAMAVAVAARPELVGLERLRVDVECAGVHTRGMTVARFVRPRAGEDLPPNVDVALTVDAAAFAELLVSRIAGLDAACG